ncbi:MAG: FHA domain-containing protein [Methylacidiphilales bacterium]|nr:FHA domain-containing protein [Candidatus Methylacidiphilales bacterium]
MAEVKNICLEALERHCASGDTGRLDFRRGSYEGQIYTDDRLIVHAQLSALEGIPALFRLFDWGDAETTWQPGIYADQQTLHLSMEAASLLYAENLQDRAELEAREKERVDQALAAPEIVAGQQGGVESVLKHYNVRLECTDAELLPGGFTFADANKSSYVIGSSEDCDVVLRNSSVDPLHCGVILEKGSVMVWDLGAQSGIKINGRPVTEDTLKVGDVMTLGALDLRVRFQLRRPTIKPKPAPAADPKAPPTTIPPTGTMPMPNITRRTQTLPKGAITYEKVARQLKQRGKGSTFLAKLTSLFGAKKPK